MERHLTWNDFADAAGTEYVVAGEGREGLEMILERAVELPASGREGGAFRLEFRGPLEPILPQAIYRFTSGGETLEIFIVPIGQAAGGTLYEAIFY